MEEVPKGKELDYSTPAAQGIQKEKSVLDAFWAWISSQAPKKETHLEKAVNYAQNNKVQFF